MPKNSKPTSHGGQRPGSGRRPNIVPSQRIVIHATDEELRRIMQLPPRARAEVLLNSAPPSK